MQQSHMKWYILIVATLFFWATQHPALKVIGDAMDPVLSSFVRFLLVAVALAPFVFKERVILEKKHWSGVFLIGFTLALFSVVNLYGIARTSATNNSILVNTWPLMVVLLAPLFLKEKLKWKALLGCMIGFVGVYLVLSNGQNIFSNAYVYGNSIILLSALIFSIYTIQNKFYIHEYGGLVILFWSTAIASILLFLFSLFYVGLGELLTLSWFLWFVIFWISVPTTALTWVIWFRTVKAIGLVETSAFFFLLPIFAVFFNWLLLGEGMTWFMVFGLVLVLVGVSIVQIKKSVDSKV